MKIKALLLMAAVSLVAAGTAGAVDGGSGLGAGEAHNASGPQGTCSKCHIPHGGKGDKIWAADLTATTDFTGVHLLCNSCHYTGNSWGAVSGIPSVFTLGAFQNHSMNTWADTTTTKVTIPGGGLFPLDLTDTDTIWGITAPDGDGANHGFYCGSCHNPHKQPFTNITGAGDYLRVDTAQAADIAAFGGSGARVGACVQCHPNTFSAGAIATGHSGNCMICHDPHRGATVATGAGDALIASKILKVDATTLPFSAPPNVISFSDTYAGQIAGVCYNCHSQVGAGFLPDNSAQLTDTSEHHPMGINTPFGAASVHAPGATSAIVGAEMTCTSCHDMHNGTQDFYLKAASGTYTGTASDSGTYCVTCHSNKTVANLGAQNANSHNMSKASSPVTVTGDEGGTGQGECFMCHYIHDGATNATAANPGDDPSEDTLMKVQPVNLVWAATAEAGDGDALDYEDMCFGCHSNTAITGTPAGIGNASFPNTAGDPTFESHIFTGTPSASGDSPVATNMTAAGLPVGAAATLALPGGEYGVVAGDLYCGTCHNVHVQSGTDSEGQYFRRTNNSASVRSGLCTDCHGASPMVGGSGGVSTHPTGAAAVLPTTPITAATVPATYGDGGDGRQGGRSAGSVPGGGTATGQMQCETCHNFHNSVTNRLGGNADHSTAGSAGKLMITDNSASLLCNNCHTAY